MSNKWYIIIAVAVVAIVVGWLIWGRKAKAPTVGGSPTPSGNANISPTPAVSGQPSGSVWEGTLQVSDNAARGSLMLLTTVQGRENKLYLRTARDFTALVGKMVWVTYTGTLDNFILINIIAK